MSVKIIIVTKSGALNEEIVKNISSDEECIQKTYKKCCFKKVDNFILQCEFTRPDIKTTQIKVFGKKTGRAMCENTYEFPPPLDKTLLFGSCCLIAYNKLTNKYEDLSKIEWINIYEKLFGGFEDLMNTDDEESEDELESIDKKYLSNGYLLDGFVVNDKRLKNMNELSEDEYTDIIDDEDEYDDSDSDEDEDEDEDEGEEDEKDDEEDEKDDEDDEDEEDTETDTGEEDDEDNEEDNEEEEQGEEQREDESDEGYKNNDNTEEANENEGTGDEDDDTEDEGEG